MLQDLEFDLEDSQRSDDEDNKESKPTTTFDSNTDPFEYAVRRMAKNVLQLATARDTRETFQNVTESSEAAHLIGTIVTEKIQEIVKTSLQCSRFNAADTVSSRTGSWDTVLGAATLLDVPPR